MFWTCNHSVLMSRPLTVHEFLCCSPWSLFFLLFYIYLCLLKMFVLDLFWFERVSVGRTFKYISKVLQQTNLVSWHKNKHQSCSLGGGVFFPSSLISGGNYICKYGSDVWCHYSHWFECSQSDPPWISFCKYMTQHNSRIWL